MNNQLKALNKYPQFVLWDRSNKRPVDAYDLITADAQDPDGWVSAEEAQAQADANPSYGVGFVLTAEDPFFVVDIDHCIAEDGTLSDTATGILEAFRGAAVERSQSGRGIHIWGHADAFEHACKNTAEHIELYTEGRYIALTGDMLYDVGQADVDFSTEVKALAAQYFKRSALATLREWTTECTNGWTGPRTVADVLAAAHKSKSARAIFGGGCSFADLFSANADALSVAYPDASGRREYDESSADLALASHLVYWAGGNCELALEAMRESELNREKWNRDDYLERTILRALPAKAEGAEPLVGASAPQKAFAESIRSQKLAEFTGSDADREILLACTDAKTWTGLKDEAPEAIVSALTPITGAQSGAQGRTGMQIFTGELQEIEFKGYTSVVDRGCILSPLGDWLDKTKFNIAIGGGDFVLDHTGKTTRCPWTAFTLSHIRNWPKADTAEFHPQRPSLSVFQNTDGRRVVNDFTGIKGPRVVGDPSRFVEFLEKLIPDKRDRLILTSYLAACIQHIGVKFQWAPFIQGVQGNGKTLLFRVMEYALGEKYTHMPGNQQLREKHNGWMARKLFVSVEEADLSGDLAEKMKTMITNDRIDIREMGVDSKMQPNYANFMLNGNEKGTVPKTNGDRRYAVFYAAQQTVGDLTRDGMGGLYFPALYSWLRAEGYAIVAEYLHTFQIPDELNPATTCTRAPETTSEAEAISNSQGELYAWVSEAISEGELGFKGGFASSIHIKRFFRELPANVTRGHRIKDVRDIILSLGYVRHPALAGGTLHTPVGVDGLKKPTIYVRKDSEAIKLTRSASIAAAYTEAQNA